MKTKKASLAAIIASVVLIFAIISVFATSASADSKAANGKKKYLVTLPGDDFTQEESQKLFDLWFDRYEAMTVAEFQERVWTQTDTPEYMELMERFSRWNVAYSMENGKESDALSEFFDYYHNICEPLTGDKWQTREFSDFVMTDLEPSSQSSPNVMWEYVLSMEILQPEKLTVEEYNASRLQVKKDMGIFLQSRTKEEIMETEAFLNAADDEVARIIKQESSDKLKISIEYSLNLPDGAPGKSDMYYEGSINNQVERGWDEILSPYVEFGLTYQFVPSEENPGNGLKMYWQGKEVRGIFDTEEGTWISEHTGDTGYAGDAVELYVVYDEGKRTGLRVATKEEQAEWDVLREQARGSFMNEKEDVPKEERKFPNGSKEDYDSLFALMTPGYEKMSLTDFNDALLAWCNEDGDRMERIGEDDYYADYAVPLTEQEKSFVGLTVWLSRLENSMVIKSERTGEPEKDPGYGGKRLEKVSESVEGRTAWCTLDYEFTYHIADKDKLTVEERDQCVGGMQKGILEFWEETGIDELVKMSEEDVVRQLQFIAEKFSSRLLTISIDEDMVHYQCMDERYYEQSRKLNSEQIRKG